MLLLEHIIRLFAPHTCIGCAVEEDRLLCAGCAAALPLTPSRCYRCKAVTEDYAVCAACRPYTSLRQVLVATYHKDLAKELIHRMKYERAQAGMGEAADIMASLLPALPDGALLTHVPTATSRVRQRGYDHAEILARHIAHRGVLPRATLLSRVGQAHQVGSGRTARARQLQGAFRPLRTDIIKGRQVVLVDDVLTTGATLEAAAKVLKRAGAKQVHALVFAQA